MGSFASLDMQILLEARHLTRQTLRTILRTYKTFRFYLLLSLGKREVLELEDGDTKNEKKFDSFGR